MKLSNLEDTIISFCIRNKNYLFILFLSFMAICIRVSFFSYSSGDYEGALNIWFNLYKENGISYLKYNIGDYNVIYNFILALLSYIPIKSLYSIKLVSLIFDFLCAIMGGKIVKQITNNKKLSIITYIIILYLPTLLFNSSLWGQCDSIYSFFALFSIFYLIKEKYFLSFIMLGISFAFKLQAVFLLPLYIIYYVYKRKFSITYFLLIPLVNILCSTPALIMGRSLKDVLMIYYNQANLYSNYVLNFPNMYMFIGEYDNLDKFGIYLIIVIFAFMLYYIISKKIKLEGKNIIFTAMISVIISCYFLPFMHDRYLFMADIMSVIWYILNKNSKYLYVPIVVNLISLFTYISYLFSIAIIDFKILSLIYLLFIIKLSYDLFVQKLN